MKLSLWAALAAGIMTAGIAAAMGSGRVGPAPLPTPRGDGPAATAAAPLDVIEAATVTPSELLWQARPVVVFANTAADTAFVSQLAALNRDPEPLRRRDVVVIVDSDPAGDSQWRKLLRPNGFTLVVLDKDGTVIDRKPLPWDVREIVRAIDKTPLRRQEIGRRAALP